MCVRSVRPRARWCVRAPQFHALVTHSPRSRTTSAQRTDGLRGAHGECFACGARWTAPAPPRPGRRRDPPCRPAEQPSRPRPTRSIAAGADAGGPQRCVCQMAPREKACPRRAAHFGRCRWATAHEIAGKSRISTSSDRRETRRVDAPRCGVVCRGFTRGPDTMLARESVGGGQPGGDRGLRGGRSARAGVVTAS